jgi:N6-adenosine-specific RNA methylase IME4
VRWLFLKKYDIIYVDPPWTYRDKALSGNRGAECKYPVLSLEDLRNLNIQELASDHCAMFMWVTFPMLAEGLELIKTYGFTYKTVGFVWIKTNKKSGGFFMGMGNYSRSNAEVCLIGIKGRPQRVSKSIRQVVESPLEQHSKKPGIVRDRIVELMGDKSRIEIFAREKIEGWDCLGNDVDGLDIRETLKKE